MCFFAQGLKLIAQADEALLVVGHGLRVKSTQEVLEGFLARVDAGDLFGEGLQVLRRQALNCFCG